MRTSWKSVPRVRLLTLGAALIAFVSCETSDEPATRVTPDSSAPAPAPDSLVAPLYPASRLVEAPDFTLPTLDGPPFSLRAHRGQVVVLNFWATWCAPCLQEMPDFVALQDALGPRGLQVVGVSLDEAAEDQVRSFAERLDVTYPIGIDDGSLEKAYGPLSIMPTTYVLDRAGRLRYYAPGMLTRDALEPVLLALLAEPE